LNYYYTILIASICTEDCGFASTLNNEKNKLDSEKEKKISTENFKFMFYNEKP